MRVTTHMLYQQASQNLDGLRERISKAQNAVNGKVLERPSDDPVKVGQALDALEAKSRADRSVRASQDAKDWLSASETAMTGLMDRLQATQDVILNAGGANMTDPNSREALAKQVDSLRESMKSIANTQHRGRYLFSGFKTDQKPFDDDPGTGGVIYSGDSGSIQHEVVPGINLRSNVSGDTLTQKGDFFDSLTKLAADLRNNDQPAVLNNRLQEIKTAFDHMADVRGEIGTRYDQVDVHEQASQEISARLEMRLGEITGADVETAVVDLYSAQSAYQTAIGTIQQAIKMIDFASR